MEYRVYGEYTESARVTARITMRIRERGVRSFLEMR